MSRQRYLVCYDIRADDRLRAVHRVARMFGHPLQYSVFACDLNRSERVRMEQALRDVMLLSIDSVVFVDLGDAKGRGTECFRFLGYRPYRLPKGGPTIV